jgi:hypothetical protein
MQYEENIESGTYESDVYSKPNTFHINKTLDGSYRDEKSIRRKSSQDNELPEPILIQSRDKEQQELRLSEHKGQIEKHEIASESPDNLITVEEDPIKSGKPIALQDRVLM